MKGRIEKSAVVRSLWYARQPGEEGVWLFFHNWNDALAYVLTGKIPR